VREFSRLFKNVVVKENDQIEMLQWQAGDCISRCLLDHRVPHRPILRAGSFIADILQRKRLYQGADHQPRLRILSGTQQHLLTLNPNSNPKLMLFMCSLHNVRLKTWIRGIRAFSTSYRYFISHWTLRNSEPQNLVSEIPPGGCNPRLRICLFLWNEKLAFRHFLVESTFNCKILFLSFLDFT